VSTDFKLPELGEQIEYGDVVNILVAEGDTLEDGQNVLELETDKAVVEVPISQSGQVTKVHVSKGDRVNIGDVILTLEKGAGEASAAPPSETAKPKEPAVSSPPPAEPEGGKSQTAPATSEPAHDASSSSQPHSPSAATATPRGPAAVASNGKPGPAPAGPATRRLARQLGVDLHAVKGSGRGGRITAEDVQAFVRDSMTSPGAGRPESAAGAAPPLPDFSEWGEIERQRLTGIRRKTAENMAVAWQTVPHVTQFDVADITDIEAARKSYEARRKGDAEAKLTVTVLAMKACVAVLKEMPQFNSSLDTAADELILKRYFHIGIAVDTEHGLLVPVVRDVDQKPIPKIATELQDIASRARDRKVGLEEMQGGTFTITNLGGVGGVGFTPIVNYPQVAILGIARARQEYVVVDGEPAIRLMMPLSLSYDHRAIDGADGARFLRRVAALLSDPFELMLGI
jgi:pyruvate dehydrogenase E2 component (dihydrolipoamide acetyltransferase)